MEASDRLPHRSLLQSKAIKRIAPFVAASTLLIPAFNAAKGESSSLDIAGKSRTEVPAVEKEAAPRIDISWLPDTVQAVAPELIKYSNIYLVDPMLSAIIATQESGGNPKAESGDTALGVMQVVPWTGGLDAARALGIPGAAEAIASSDDPFVQELAARLREDIDFNIQIGVKYLSMMMEHYGLPEHGPSWDRTVELAGAGYNGGYAGGDHVIATGRGIDKENEDYRRRTLGMWRERHDATSPAFEEMKSVYGQGFFQDAARELAARGRFTP